MIATLIKYLFTLFGAVMLAGTFYLSQDTRAFLASAVQAEGTVIELVRSHKTYRPVIRFTDRHDQTVEFTSSAGSNPPSYAVGEKVAVLYLPEKPHTAEIDDFFMIWGGLIILGILGVVFFLIGAGLFIASLRRQRTASRGRTAAARTRGSR